MLSHTYQFRKITCCVWHLLVSGHPPGGWGVYLRISGNDQILREISGNDQILREINGNDNRCFSARRRREKFQKRDVLKCFPFRNHVFVSKMFACGGQYDFQSLKIFSESIIIMIAFHSHLEHNWQLKSVIGILVRVVFVIHLPVHSVAQIKNILKLSD